MKEIYKEAYDYIRKECKKGACIIVAVSGGPDSMALLHMLIQLRYSYKYKIICAHVNHNVRKESEEEKVFVENFCKQNNVIFEYMKIENYKEENFHKDAREKRYEFFENLVHKYHADYLCTAHHGDDLIETMLMRVVRGSTINGYSGFARKDERNGYKIIRPFITITKEDILSYNKIQKIPYVIDGSNEKEVYTRNRYRKNILPYLKKEDKNVHKKFYKMSEKLIEYHKFVKTYIDKELPKVYTNDILDIPLFQKEESLIQKELIHLILEKVYKNELNHITDKHVNLIYEAIHNRKPNIIIYLPMKMEVVKSYNKLFFKKKNTEKKSYKIEIKEKVDLPNGHSIEKIVATNENSNFICRLNQKEITLPLFVRTRKPGDKMLVKGMNGRQKIKDIFIDKKIDLEKRSTWPVVVDANDTIIWLPGLKKTQFDKPKEEMYDIILKYY